MVWAGSQWAFPACTDILVVCEACPPWLAIPVAGVGVVVVEAVGGIVVASGMIVILRKMGVVVTLVIRAPVPTGWGSSDDDGPWLFGRPLCLHSFMCDSGYVFRRFGLYC